MATYRITAPDGNSYEVTAPDDATEAQVLAYAQQNYQSASQPDFSNVRSSVSQNQPADLNPTTGMSGFDRFAAGVGKSIVDTGRGLKQAGTSAVRHLASDPTGGSNAVTRWADRSLARQQQEIDRSRQLDAPLMDTGAGLAGNITGAVLQTAIPVGGVAARGAALAGRAAPYAGAAARGAAFSAAQPVATGESRAVNTAIGGAAGVAGQGIANVAGRAATRAKDALAGPVRDSIAAAQKAGIPLHLSQVSDSRFLKGLSSVLNSLPFTGAGRAARNQQQAFNRAVGQTFGVDAPTLTDDVMAQARQGIGQVYDNVFNRNTVALDRGTINRMLMVEREATRNLTEEQARVVSNQFQRVIDEFAEGPITGQKYQALRGALADVADNSTLGRAVKGLRNALDEAAFKSVGQVDASLLKQANTMWANMRTAQKALQQIPGAAGNVRPASLFPLVRGGSTTEMRELAKVGQNVLKDPIPNSGTPERQLIYNLLGLGGGLYGASSDNPWMRAAGGGLLAGHALNSSTLARLVTASQPARAAATSGLARLAQGTPYALPALANARMAAGPGAPPLTAEEMAALQAQMDQSR